MIRSLEHRLKIFGGFPEYECAYIYGLPKYTFLPNKYCISDVCRHTVAFW